MIARSIAIVAALLAYDASVSAQVPYTFSPGTPAKASEVNANFTYLWGQLAPLVIFPYGNTALGFNSYKSSDGTANANTAVGDSSLSVSGPGGSQNTAVGAGALQSNAAASYNTAIGTGALRQNTTGIANTAVGMGALGGVTTGAFNIGIGHGYGDGWAGGNITSGSWNIDIGNRGDASDNGVIRVGQAGTHVKAFLAGIYGVTTGGPAVPAVVDANGQLGTVASSRRFKQDIQDMGSASDALMRLRPVTFRYKQPQDGGARPIQYGLIAEEVAEVFPELVARDPSGEPLTVLYQELPALLLGQAKKQQAEIVAQRARIAELERQNAAWRATAEELAELRTQVASLKAASMRARRSSRDE